MRKPRFIAITWKKWNELGGSNPCPCCNEGTAIQPCGTATLLHAVCAECGNEFLVVDDKYATDNPPILDPRTHPEGSYMGYYFTKNVAGQKVFLSERTRRHYVLIG